MPRLRGGVGDCLLRRMLQSVEKWPWFAFRLSKENFMQRRQLIQTAGLTALALSMSLASAQDSNKFKIGLILPMTGQQASTGRQIEAAARL